MNHKELPPHFQRAFMQASQEELHPIGPVAVILARTTPISAYTWQKMLDTLNNAETESVSTWAMEISQPPPPQTRIERFLAWIQSWRS